MNNICHFFSFFELSISVTLLLFDFKFNLVFKLFGLLHFLPPLFHLHSNSSRFFFCFLKEKKQVKFYGQYCAFDPQKISIYELVLRDFLPLLVSFVVNFGGGDKLRFIICVGPTLAASRIASNS